MKFNITTNKELDVEVTGWFFEGGSRVIQDFWPEIQVASDIPRVIEAEYGEALYEKITLLQDNVGKLDLIAGAISEVIDEEWSPIDTISIWVGTCPIAPRFLDNYSFLMPYYHDLNYMISTSAHDMIHFLYFKKWAKLFPKHQVSRFESPDPVWVLSEILVSIIGNDDRIKNIVGSKFEVYPNWMNTRIAGQTVTGPFEKIYANSNTFDDFLKKSWVKYQDLDKQHNITEKLASNPF